MAYFKSLFVRHCDFVCIYIVLIYWYNSKKMNIKCFMSIKILLLKHNGVFWELYYATPSFLLGIFTESGFWVVNFILLALKLFFYSNSFWGKIIRASIDGHFLSLDKGFFECFFSSNAPNCLIILFFSYRFLIFVYFLGGFFSRVVDTLYYGISKALVILVELIIFKNISSFMIHYIANIFLIYQSISI